MKTRAFSIFFLHSSEQKVVEQVFRRPYYCIRRPAASQRFVGMGFFSLLSLTKIRTLKINQTNQNSSPGQSLKYDIIRTKLQVIRYSINLIPNVSNLIKSSANICTIVCTLYEDLFAHSCVSTFLILTTILRSKYLSSILYTNVRTTHSMKYVRHWLDNFNNLCTQLNVCTREGKWNSTND